MSKTRRMLLILLGIALLRRPADMLLKVLLPDASVAPAAVCIGGMMMTILLLGVPAWLMRPWQSLRLPQQKSRTPGILLGAVMAVVCRAAITPLDGAWQAWLNVTPDALPMPESVPMAMLYILTLAVIPALAEEAFFRGALLTSLLDGSRRVTAVLLTAVSFALMHGSLAQLPGHLVFSLLLTLLMIRTGRIAVPMAAHFVYNLTALNWVSVPLWGSALCGLALIALAAWIIIRRPKYAHPPMKGTDGLIAAAALAAMAASYLI